jgi:hypothetical protein
MNERKTSTAQAVTSTAFNVNLAYILNLSSLSPRTHMIRVLATFSAASLSQQPTSPKKINNHFLSQ